MGEDRSERDSKSPSQDMNTRAESEIEGRNEENRHESREQIDMKCRANCPKNPHHYRQKAPSNCKPQRHREHLIIASTAKKGQDAKARNQRKERNGKHHQKIRCMRLEHISRNSYVCSIEESIAIESKQSDDADYEWNDLTVAHDRVMPYRGLP